MNIREFLNNGFSVMRGILKKYKFSGSGSLLRIERGVRIWTNNGEVECGNRVFLHRHVKLSAYVKGPKKEKKIYESEYHKVMKAKTL